MIIKFNCVIFQSIYCVKITFEKTKYANDNDKVSILIEINVKSTHYANILKGVNGFHGHYQDVVLV